MTNEEFALARYIAEDEATLQSLILVHYGVPFDVAFSLDPIQRFAYVAALKTMFEDILFDWDAKRWREKKPAKVIGGG